MQLWKMRVGDWLSRLGLEDRISIVDLFLAVRFKRHDCCSLPAHPGEVSWWGKVDRQR